MKSWSTDYYLSLTHSFQLVFHAFSQRRDHDSDWKQQKSGRVADWKKKELGRS